MFRDHIAIARPTQTQERGALRIICGCGTAFPSVLDSTRAHGIPGQTANPRSEDYIWCSA